MSKRVVSLILTLSLLIGVLSVQAFASFNDVPDDGWYSDAVDYAYMNGLFSGTGENNFSPDMTMSRSMFVCVLYRMCREQRTDYPATSFPDVPEEGWYTNETNWAVANGLVNGTSWGTFSPDDPITREQMCKLIGIFCEYIGFSLPEIVERTIFPDEYTISDYALPYVDSCVKAGLIKGCGDGSMNPAGEASRAEVATILYRLGLLMEDAGYVVGPGNPSADWRMILVNRWNPIPTGYVNSISLSYITSNQRLDSRAVSDYNAMIYAMQAAGLVPYVNSAFRTNSYQQTLYNNKIYTYMSYGYSRSQAELLAQQWVAVPGTSEHELGLAIDFNMNMYNSTAVHTWLANNAHNYGFIYRYQADKTDITGINPEEWHYRYVGRDNAIRIKESGLCMEEYVEKYSR